MVTRLLNKTVPIGQRLLFGAAVVPITLLPTLKTCPKSASGFPLSPVIRAATGDASDVAQRFGAALEGRWVFVTASCAALSPSELFRRYPSGEDSLRPTTTRMSIDRRQQDDSLQIELTITKSPMCSQPNPERLRASSGTSPWCGQDMLAYGQIQNLTSGSFHTEFPARGPSLAPGASNFQFKVLGGNVLEILETSRGNSCHGPKYMYFLPYQSV